MELLERVLKPIKSFPNGIHFTIYKLNAQTWSSNKAFYSFDETNSTELKKEITVAYEIESETSFFCKFILFFYLFNCCYSFVPSNSDLN